MAYSKRAWIIWGVATLFVGFQLFIGILFGIASKEIAVAFSMTVNNISKLSAAYFFFYACMQIPAGLILDRFSVKYIFFAGAFFITISLFLLGTTHSIGLAFIVAMIMGIGSSFCFVGAIILNSRWFPAEMFSVATGLTSGCNGLIASLLGFILSFTVTNEKVITTAFIGIIITLLILLLLKDYPKGTKVEKVSCESKDKNSIWKGLYAAISNCQIVLASLMTTLIYGSMLAFITFWNIQYQELYNLSEKTISIINIIVLFGIAIGAPVSGWLSERIGKRKPVGYIICIGLFICLSILLQPIKLSLPSVFAVMFFIGLFSNNVAIGFSIVKENSAPSYMGTAMALANTILYLGFSLMEFIPGTLIPYFSQNKELLIHTYRSQDISIMSMADFSFLIAIILAFICLIFIKETNCKAVFISEKTGSNFFEQ